MEPAKPIRQLTLIVQETAQAILQDLSAVRCIGDHIWLGSDEGTDLERLTLEGDTTSDHQSIPVARFLDLPEGESKEIDIEGLSYADYYLWIVGSHSLKRKKPKLDSSHEEALARLQVITREENRYLLGRIPLVDGQLYREYPHPEDPKKMLTAAQLKRKQQGGNQLTHCLQADPHLGAYLAAAIPGKENGFDIEGVAVKENRVFLGLRGPVLRGWAVLLELSLTDDGPGLLKIKKLEGTQRYRKHLLDLQGLGIRDLCWDGDDLLVLAGPTMDLSGLAEVFRIPNAVETLSQNACLKPEPILDLLDKRDSDKAEGISLMAGSPGSVLVVYDAPSAERLTDYTVIADVFSLNQ
ncbi:DUF3616 domain-containing protein [Pseudanabaena sp. FACHB-2040]|uniref:DUF3616 domain-containing protein n=1 Tax=Pseudanabaena sp. FACHB-2040 TaxID=2692859 RepID=UPI00168441E2|nr:DUF3616 domain-containing protein [Pseudanabaena sp. FACHB-2040]MBD2257618.1 DUF3616 domain-containing protein [Pseudanabaena sp. FACHB-2040]